MRVSTIHRPWWGLGALCLGMVMLFMNTTMINVALPDLSASLGAGTSQLEWIVSSYNLAFLAVLLPGGAVGDRLGHRTTLIAGCATFGVGALVGAASGTVSSLMAARVLMGVGASVFTPMSLALIPRIVPPAQRGLATGVWTAAGALGAPLGPLVGGVMIDAHGWRSMFVLDLVAAAVVLASCLVLVPAGPRSQRDGRALPWAQVVTSAAGFSLITWGLINAEHSWTRPSTWAPIVTGAGVLAFYAALDLHRLDTLTDLWLLGVRRFRTRAVELMLVNFVLFGILFVAPSYLQTVLGNSAVRGGMMLMPLATFAVVGSLAASTLLRHPRTHPWVMPAALGLVAAGLALAARTSPAAGPLALEWGLVVAGTGLGLAQSFGIATAMDAVPPEAEGAGAALLNTVRQFGSVLGIAALGSVAGSVYTQGVTPLPTHLPDQLAQAVSDTIASAHLALQGQTGPWAHALLTRADYSYVHAMDRVLTICALASAAVAIASALAATRARPARGCAPTQQP